MTRRFGTFVAVDAVSFAVEPGEVVGFLGPNGSGKTTCLRMLSTSLARDAGEIRVAGIDPSVDPLGVRAHVGYLAEHNPLFESMRVGAWLEFAGDVRGLAPERARTRRAWVVERLQLGDVLKKRVRECSKGFRQRIGLAAALLPDPPVLLLDEPTHGLDPLQVVAFRDLVRELRPGRAILLSSHVLAEVVESADRLLAIQRGRIVLDRPVADLRADERRTQKSIETQVLDAVRAGAAA